MPGERERVRALAESLCRGDFTSVLRSTRNESLLAAVAAAVDAAAEDDTISTCGKFLLLLVLLVLFLLSLVTLQPGLASTPYTLNSRSD